MRVDDKLVKTMLDCSVDNLVKLEIPLPGFSSLDGSWLKREFEKRFERLK